MVAAWLVTAWDAPLTVARAKDGVPAAIVEAFDIWFAPTALAIPAETDVVVAVANRGASPHNFGGDGLGISADVWPGKTRAVTVNAPAGVSEFSRNGPGHKPAGMVGTPTVSVEAIATASPVPTSPVPPPSWFTVGSTVYVRPATAPLGDAPSIASNFILRLDGGTPPTDPRAVPASRLGAAQGERAAPRPRQRLPRGDAGADPDARPPAGPGGPARGPAARRPGGGAAGRRRAVRRPWGCSPTTRSSSGSATAG